MEEMDSSYKSVKKKEGFEEQGVAPRKHFRNLSVDFDPLPSMGNQSRDRESLPNQPMKKRMTMIVDPEQQPQFFKEMMIKYAAAQEEQTR